MSSYSRSWDEQHSYVRIILIVSLNINAPYMASNMSNNLCSSVLGCADFVSKEQMLASYI